MPRNYDEMRDAEDRDFIVRGETFTLRRCRPEVLAELEEAEKQLGDGVATYAELVKFSEDRLMVLIDDRNGAVARWRALRERDDDPITYGEIMDLSRWAVTEITGLPTMPPAPSAPSPASSKPTSKAG